MKNTIDLRKCLQCKLCMEVCPCRIIGLNEEKQLHFFPERESICLECGQCMAVCKSKAIQLKGLSYDKDFTELADHKVDYTNFTHFLASRRSVRNFKQKEVETELIEQLLDSISYAPFGAHPEKMHITVVNKREKIEEALPLISKFLDKIVTLVENPVASFIVKRSKTKEEFNTIKNHLYPIAKLENYKLEHGDGISRGAPALLIFHADKGAEAHTNNAIIHATYASLAAHALGLGATMIEVITPAINTIDEVKRLWNIPKHHEAVMTLIIGYPKINYQRAIKRDRTKIHWLN